MKKIASPTRETTYTGRLSVKADYAGRPVLLVREFFPAFDNHDAFEIVEDRIINSACIDSIPSVHSSVATVYARSRHCVKKINRDFPFFSFFLSPRYEILFRRFIFRKWREKRRGGKRGIVHQFRNERYNKSSFGQTRFDVKLSSASCYSIIANFFNEHIDTVDDEMWARPRKPDPD